MELKLQSLSERAEWEVFLKWLKKLELVAFEQAYNCKKDESKERYFGKIAGYREITNEIKDIQIKAEETAEQLKELKKEVEK